MINMSEDHSEEHQPEPKPKRTLITISIILNILLAAGIGVLYNQNNMMNQELTQYAQSLTSTSENLMKYEQQLNMTQTQLNYYKDLANQLSSSTTTSDTSPSIIGQATVPIVAVKTVQSGFTAQYVGEVMQANIELVKGEGRVLVNTQVINGADIQASLRTATAVASQLTNVSFSGTDVILTIEGGSDVQLVDGPSAGAALTIGVYAAITGKTPVSNVYMTGTINSDGSIGQIGGVEYKAQAVAEAGGTTFLIPVGQSNIVTYKAVTKSLGRSTFTYYEPVNVDLKSYLADNGYNVNIVEVANIIDAMQYFFSN
jgi:predicted S18 family serine protease